VHNENVEKKKCVVTGQDGDDDIKWGGGGAAIMKGKDGWGEKQKSCFGEKTGQPVPLSLWSLPSLVAVAVWAHSSQRRTARLGAHRDGSDTTEKIKSGIVKR